MTTPSAVSLNRQVCTAEMPRRRPSQITSRPGPQRTTRGSTWSGKMKGFTTKVKQAPLGEAVA